jgi:Zn-dependent membrane protease YugP
MLLYIVLMLPAIALTLWAQAKVQGTYKKYSQVPASATGAQAARRVLDAKACRASPSKRSPAN